MVFQLSIGSNDCIILITGLTLLLNVIIILFYLRTKKMIKTFSGSQSIYGDITELAEKCSQLNSEFEKVAMIRIAELEDRISHLKQLVTVADERILQIIEFQKTLEQTALSAGNGIKSQAVNDSDLITRFRLNMKPDLSNLEIRMVQKIREECAKNYSDLMNKIEDLKIKHEPHPKPQKEIHAIQPSQAGGAQSSVLNIINPPNINSESNAATTHHGKIKQTGYIVPHQHLEPAVVNDKCFEVYKLADQGLDAAAISEITKMEKRAVNFILSLKKIQ